MVRARGALLVLMALLALGVGAPAAPLVAPPAAEAAVLPQLRVVRMGMIVSSGGAPLYLAQERGWFAAEGIDWQYEPLQVTSEALAQVGTGNLDLANVTIGAAVLNSLVRGLDIKIIAGNSNYPPNGPAINAFMMRKDLYDSGMTDASGLRGRKVAGNAVGVFTEYAIDKALRTGGLTIDDVEFVPVPFPDMPAAFANKVIDAGFLIEPSVTIARTQGTAVQIVPDWLRGAQETILMAGPGLLRDRALAEAFLRVYLRGIRTVQAEGFTPEVVALVERHTRVSPELLMQLRPPYWDPDGRVNWDSLMDQQSFYMARGSATYREPLDLPRLLGDDGPRQAAVASLAR